MRSPSCQHLCNKAGRDREFHHLSKSCRGRGLGWGRVGGNQSQSPGPGAADRPAGGRERDNLVVRSLLSAW